MSYCKKCGIEFTPSKGLINYCSLQCRNSRVFSEETKQRKRNSNLNQIPWNKGEKLKWVKSICIGCGNDINHLKSKPKKYHPECWIKLSGGYRKGSGVGKSGWYKGYWCDSSYELAWVIYNLDHGHQFTRNKVTYEYFWDNKLRKYVPDFIKNDNLIEIKGFVDSHTQVKLDSVSNLKILFRDDLVTEFDYVETNYGKDFIRLYEGNPYRKLTNTCKVCGKACINKNVYCSRTCSGIGNNRNSKLN
jgi:hypothetical protein